MKKTMVTMAWVIGMATMAAADDPRPHYSLLSGVTISNNMGENRWAPYMEGRVDSHGWRVAGQGELSRKVESGAGYRLGIDVERSYGPLVASGGYRYRNGGTWAKQTIWAGGGVRTSHVSLLVRRELPTTQGGNGTVSGAITLNYQRVEWQGTAYSYRPTGGGNRQVGYTALLGYRLER